MREVTDNISFFFRSFKKHSRHYRRLGFREVREVTDDISCVPGIFCVCLRVCLCVCVRERERERERESPGYLVYVCVCVRYQSGILCVRV